MSETQQTEQEHHNHEEEKIWEGRPSQITNLGNFIFMTLCSALSLGAYIILYPKIEHKFGFDFALIPILFVVIPLISMLWSFLVTRNKYYIITNERIKYKTGVFSDNYNYFELYQVRDYIKEVPFVYKFFNLCNISLITGDRSNHFFTINGIDSNNNLVDTIRNMVEDNRQRKNVSVSEVDFYRQ